jgi:hypothetical protein
MAGAIQLTEVDFERIKTNLVNYLKSTKEFTDYNFEGSNLSVILNLIAYQAQLNAYTANMVANESFLASASLRDNVVTNAKQIGYLPTSARSAKSEITFTFTLDPDDYLQGLPEYLEIQPGLAFSTNGGEGNLIFNIIDVANAAVSSDGTATFRGISIFEGTFLPAEFIEDEANFNQRFILENTNIDSSTIRVEVQEDPNEDLTQFYRQADNLTTVTSESRVYWLEEVDNGFYQLTFGDGYFGRKLVNGSKIHVTYVVTNGVLGNGVRGTNNFVFAGEVFDSFGTNVTSVPAVSAVTPSSSGAQIESIPSIKFRAPKSYESQNRAVVASDYDTIIRQVYPAADDVYVYGGETMDPPLFGRVFIAIKPVTGDKLSNLEKTFIKSSLEPYRVASLDLIFVDPTVLNIEAESLVYYNELRTLKDNAAIVTQVKSVLESYEEATSISKFGGAIRYSKIVGAIDGADAAITRNVTNLVMRKDINVRLNAPSTYEICFENALKLDRTHPVVSSTGFYMTVNGVNLPNIYYFEDDTKGNIYSFYYNESNTKVIANTLFGTVDYETGELELGYIKGQEITIYNTVLAGGMFQVRAIPRDNDIVVDKSVYINFDVASSNIQSTVDTRISGS